VNPQVTVLMSVHNGREYVQAAIDSILAQSFGEFEFLIIDDASDDGTTDVLRACNDRRIRVSRVDPNIGLTACLNRGLELARGALIARQDADDLSHPERLARQFGFLREHPNVVVVGCQARLIDAKGRALGRKDFPLEHRGIDWMTLFDNPLAHSAVMFRRSVVVEAGRYNETYPASQDYELWSRLAEYHALANLPDRLATLRVVDTSITRTHKRPELIRSIQRAHFKRLIGREATDEELNLIGMFRTHVEPDRLAEFHVLFDSMLVRYETNWPNVRHQSDFRRTLALQYERIGYNLLTTSRRDGLREITRAVRTHPASLFSIPWVRVGALALMGDNVRQIYERVTGARSSNLKRADRGGN
jgi:glycosyltransferase involved in cell wall biosynthesis